MKVNQLIPVVENRVQFSFKAHKFVPAESGCYVLTNFDNEVLYIGLTDNLHRRFAEHRDTKEKRQETSQGTAFWFYYLPYEEKEVNRLERTWLNLYMESHGVLPILNKVYSPVR
jgi:predicted GIY-YIG superfamily endonuclease